MSIKLKLGLAFGAIALMLCANVGVYFWSMEKRESAQRGKEQAQKSLYLLEDTEKALAHQTEDARFLADLFVGDSVDSVGLAEPVKEILAAKDIILAQFDEVFELHRIEANPEIRGGVDLEEAVNQLSIVWGRFAQHISDDPARAIRIFTLEAEPMNEQFLEDILPELIAHERDSLVTTVATLADINKTTSRVSMTTFALTLALIALIALAAFRAQDTLARQTVDLIGLEKDIAKKSAELETASHIQAVMLPQSMKLPGYDTAMIMKPALDVGGDFFDSYRDGLNRVWISIGDVSGHGLEAGLVMMMTQTLFGAVVSQNQNSNDPKSVILTLNRLLYEYIQGRFKMDKHITAMILRDEGEGRLSFAGAHERLLVYRAAQDEVEEIDNPGGWLGVFPDIEYCTQEGEVKLGAGDVLMLYTDGITETQNGEGELFGMERLAGILKSHNTRSAQDMIAFVMKGVQDWSSVQDDDRTCIVLKKLENTA